jgi:hypothetical protein
VALNASADGVIGISRVRPDNAAAVELPMRRLAELGHESVAFLSAPRQLMADPDRLRHFRRMAAELGLRPRIVYSLLTIPDVQQATAALLAERGAPTAIITNSDYTAHAVYKAARELSLPVGPGVSVVGHDDLPTSELLDPPLATIRMDHRAMGTALMQRARLAAVARRPATCPDGWPAACGDNSVTGLDTHPGLGEHTDAKRFRHLMAYAFRRGGSAHFLTFTRGFLRPRSRHRDGKQQEAFA